MSMIIFTVHTVLLLTYMRCFNQYVVQLSLYIIFIVQNFCHTQYKAHVYASISIGMSNCMELQYVHVYSMKLAIDGDHIDTSGQLEGITAQSMTRRCIQLSGTL